MSGPVDVLAVMRADAISAAVERQHDGDAEWCAAASDLAIAAVAELIATQRETLRMLEAAYRQLGMWTDDNKRIQRAKAALANMGTQS